MTTDYNEEVAGWFSDVDDAPVYGSGQYLTPGDYGIELTECKAFESSVERGRRFFVAEFVIVKSNNEEHIVGSHRSWLVDLQKASSASNLKGFGMALAPDADPDDIGGVMIAKLCGPGQPAAGIRLSVEAFHVPIKSAPGKLFTKHRWAPYTG